MCSLTLSNLFHIQSLSHYQFPKKSLSHYLFFIGGLIHCSFAVGQGFLLDVTTRWSSLPCSGGDSGNEWVCQKAWPKPKRFLFSSYIPNSKTQVVQFQATLSLLVVATCKKQNPFSFSIGYVKVSTPSLKGQAYGIGILSELLCPHWICKSFHTIFEEIGLWKAYEVGILSELLCPEQTNSKIQITHFKFYGPHQLIPLAHFTQTNSPDFSLSHFYRPNIQILGF